MRQIKVKSQIGLLMIFGFIALFGFVIANHLGMQIERFFWAIFYAFVVVVLRLIFFAFYGFLMRNSEKTVECIRIYLTSNSLQSDKATLIPEPKVFTPFTLIHYFSDVIPFVEFQLKNQIHVEIRKLRVCRWVFLLTYSLMIPSTFTEFILMFLLFLKFIITGVKVLLSVFQISHTSIAFTLFCFAYLGVGFLVEKPFSNWLFSMDQKTNKG